MKFYKRLLRLQGIFYFLSGIWPVIHIESFMAVTGRKFDIWLVKTVGLLIVAGSLGMLMASFRKYIQPDVLIIGLGFAGFLTLVDIYYEVNDRIAAVYLADAAVELVLILLWIWWWLKVKPRLNLLPDNKV